MEERAWKMCRLVCNDGTDGMAFLACSNGPCCAVLRAATDVVVPSMSAQLGSMGLRVECVARMSFSKTKGLGSG